MQGPMKGLEGCLYHRVGANLLLPVASSYVVGKPIFYTYLCNRFNWVNCKFSRLTVGIDRTDRNEPNTRYGEKAIFHLRTHLHPEALCVGIMEIDEFGKKKNNTRSEK